MTKSERLGQLIGMTSEEVERSIDKGIWDILIELNSKNYYTKFSCEGHLGMYNKQGIEDYWQAYLVFEEGYKFPQYPTRYTKVNRTKTTYTWYGYGEESRQDFLDRTLTWARCLPTRKKKEIKYYILTAKYKNQPNREEKLLVRSQNYEDIKLILAREDMDKYFDFNLSEVIVGEK